MKRALPFSCERANDERTFCVVICIKFQRRAFGVLEEEPVFHAALVTIPFATNLENIISNTNRIGPARLMRHTAIEAILRTMPMMSSNANWRLQILVTAMLRKFFSISYYAAIASVHIHTNAQKGIVMVTSVGERSSLLYAMV